MELQSKLKLVEAWLSLFGHPRVFTRPEFKTKKKGLDYSKNISLLSLLEYNESVRYALDFTPNGEYGDKNTVGEKIHRQIGDATPYISSVYIDIDRRDTNYRTNEELKAETIKTIETTKLKVQYIMETPGGLHLYVFILPSDRAGLGRKLGNQGFKIVQEALADMFEGGDKNSHSIAKTMRLPFSKYRKRHIAEDTKLYKVVNNKADNGDWHIELQEVTTPEEIVLDMDNVVNCNGIMTFYENQKPIGIGAENQGSSRYCNTVNELPICDVVDRLVNYPRTYSGKTYTFKRCGKEIYFDIDGKIKHTDGYRINLEGNYVNNFSMVSHDLDERPRGMPFPFLYYYFDKNIPEMKNFLFTEFGITLENNGEEVYNTFNSPQGQFQFTNKGLYLDKISSKKDSISNERVLLISAPLEVLGVTKSNQQLFGETENAVTIYILYNHKTDEQIQIQSVPSITALNKQYNLRFRSKQDTVLFDLFTAIDDAAYEGILSTFETVNLNGRYDNKFIIGNDVYDTNGELIEPSSHNLKLNTQEVLKNDTTQDQISTSDFGLALCDVFSERETMLSFTAFIVNLLGFKFWHSKLKGIKNQILVPGLFLSGITQSGKSTMMDLMLCGAGLSSDSRKYSIKSTSLQPLKQAAQDDFILRLEEFSSEIGKDKEEILRDILNCGKSGRGQQDGSNIYYKYRSSLLVDGEILPTTESVFNRFICVHMFADEKIGTAELLSWFKPYTFHKDFIKKSFTISTEQVEKDYFSSQEKLVAHGIKGHRTIENYSFLLCVNKWFGIYKEGDLIEVILKNLGLQKIGNKSPLSGFLSNVITQKKIKPSIHNVDDEIMELLIPITDADVTQFTTIFANINKELGDNKFRLENNNVIITYTTTDNSEQNQKLKSILVSFKGCFGGDAPILLVD